MTVFQLSAPTSAIAIALFLCASSALAYEAPTLADISPAQLQQARDNGAKFTDVGPAGEVNRGEVVGVIRAPMDELAVIVRDYEHIPLWSEAMVYATVNSDDGRTQIVEGETKLPWPLANRLWRIRSVYGANTVEGSPAWTNVWTHEGGFGNIDDTYGYWLLYPYPGDAGYTVVKYVINADPGLWLPDFVLNWATESVLPELLQGLERRHGEVF